MNPGAEAPVRTRPFVPRVQGMDSLITTVFAELADESGVTAIEYGLLAALIAVAIIGAISVLGVSVMDMYSAWTSAVVAAISG